jgi:hypothetical protein
MRSKRARNGRPPIRIIGSIGDCNPLAYGGGVILDHGDGAPTMVWFEPIEWEALDRYGDPTQCEVYHVALDRRQMLGDVLMEEDVYTLSHFTNPIPYSEIDRDHARAESFGYAYGGCPYPPASYTEWWDRSIADIAKSAGLTVGQLRESECSDNPECRAWFYWTVAQYHGWHELTAGEVQTERIADLRKRWALPMYWARKRKDAPVRVYA